MLAVKDQPSGGYGFASEEVGETGHWLRADSPKKDRRFSVAAGVWPWANSRMSRLTRDLIYNRFVSSALLPTRWRWRALKVLGFDVEPSLISSGCFIGTRNLRISKGVSVGYDCFFDTLAEIRLGENVAIAPQCMLITSSHRIGGPDQRSGDLTSAPIIIGDGCWLGARVTVYPGVTIGAGSVVSAGAVVTTNLPPDGVYAGNPARLVSELSERSVAVLNDIKARVPA